ncbi:hypothetical protein NHP190012_16030 [Helicobacter sp. NHP19-012]|uniref:DUF4845 domain-containing protein n=1 Tax=Helicobacter gastrofelis TaxID=2849642 RepID=A0ABM7SGE3_9HELI|nr:hypothetical protein [Helicobacter sp. NHP19-012]BCZ19961.1 hypothetical protein NHP190012_16030 [Helicobacter sp. NHP19-012]
MPTYLIVLIVVVVLGFVALVVLRKATPTAIEQEVLTMKEVIAFFKDEKVAQSLRANSSTIATAIREKQSDGRLKITLAPYDKQQSTIPSNAPMKVYLVKRMDTDLDKVFGDKDMVVLQ